MILGIAFLIFALAVTFVVFFFIGRMLCWLIKSKNPFPNLRPWQLLGITWFTWRRRR